MAIVRHGAKFSMESNGRESASLGTISFDAAGGTRFIPAPGMSFTHEMLFEISQALKGTGEAYAEQRAGS